MKTLESTNRRSVSETDLLKELNKWWGETNFEEMSMITGYRRYEFDPSDGYQEFVDACNRYWEALTTKEKQIKWNLYK
jgi:hypothetical protein